MADRIADRYFSENPIGIKIKILKNRKITILKNQNFEKSKIVRDFQNFRKNIVSKKYFSIEKKFDRFFFDEFFSEHHVRQPTLIRDASRAPRSVVAALRRKGNNQNPYFGAEIPSLTRLAEAELLTIAETTVVKTPSRNFAQILENIKTPRKTLLRFWKILRPRARSARKKKGILAVYKGKTLKNEPKRGPNRPQNR